jgi:uncharacterized protein YndB with AHSA1/START domain
MARTRARTVRLQIFIHKSPKKVFKAISEPERLARWLVDKATLSARKGGRYAFGWEGGPTHSGRVLEFVAGRRLTLTWQWPGQEDLGMTKLKMSVVPKKGGTVLKFIHSGFQSQGPWIDLHDGAIHGWTYFMMNLKSVLEYGNDLRSPLDW